LLVKLPVTFRLEAPKMSIVELLITLVSVLLVLLVT